jgi:hypothetical protein
MLFLLLVSDVYMAVVFRKRLPDEIPGSYVDLSISGVAPSTAAFHYPIPDAVCQSSTLATITPKRLEKTDIRRL